MCSFVPHRYHSSADVLKTAVLAMYADFYDVVAALVASACYHAAVVRYAAKL